MAQRFSLKTALNVHEKGSYNSKTISVGKKRTIRVSKLLMWRQLGLLASGKSLVSRCVSPSRKIFVLF